MAGRDRQNLLSHLREQADFLRADCREYDAGKEHFAKKIAAVLRTLLHHTRDSAGLLQQLGVLHSATFIDSGGELVPGGRQAAPFGALTVVQMSSEDTRYVPICHAPIRYKHLPPEPVSVQISFVRREGRKISRGGDSWPFDVWWDKLPIIIDNKKQLFSRRQIVLAVTNTDGGSHVDPKPPAWYTSLLNDPQLNFAFQDASGAELIRSPLLPSVRQIGEETLWTVDAILEG